MHDNPIFLIIVLDFIIAPPYPTSPLPMTLGNGPNYQSGIIHLNAAFDLHDLGDSGRRFSVTAAGPSTRAARGSAAP